MRTRKMGLEEVWRSLNEKISSLNTTCLLTKIDLNVDQIIYSPSEIRSSVTQQKLALGEHLFSIFGKVAKLKQPNVLM